MKKSSPIINLLILAVLSVQLFYMVQSHQADRDILTELRKSNYIGVKTYIQTKKIFRVNAELKNGVITYYK